MVQVMEIPGRDTVEPSLFRIRYEERDLTDDLSPYVTSVSWTDYLSGQSDELSVELEDKDGRWLRDWYPVKGHALNLCMTYPGQDALDCGSFEVDEINISGPPSMVTIRGLSAKVSKGVRTRKSQAYENTSLGEIAWQLAERNGYQLIGQIAELSIDRITQFQETDLTFIDRLGRLYGYVVKLRDNKLIFTQRRGLWQEGVVRVIQRGQCSRYKFTDKIKDIYSNASNTHHDPSTQQVVTGQASDSRAPEGAPGLANSADELRINQRASSAASAQAQADAALDQANDERTTGSLTLPAERCLVAGVMLTLDASWGRFAGDYLINQARHCKRRDSGAEAEIEVCRIRPASVEYLESPPKPHKQEAIV